MFTSSGTGSTQTWSGASTVNLSATEGYCYAYYPYDPSATSITAIPVTAGSTDYLYATKQSVNDKSYSVTLPMKHALSAIRFALKRGTYAGTGAVTAVSVASSALGSSGTLDATTGVVKAANLGTAVSQSASLTLSTTAQNVDVVMVPSGTAGSITLSVTIDGKVYSTTVSSTTIAQGNCYTYTLTVNAGALALSGVQVGAWGYNSAGAPTITAGGYTVTFAGNISELLFSNTVSEDGTVTIQTKALPDDGFPKAVTKSGTATLSQSVSGMVRTITLTGVGSNVTVTFNGYATPPAAIADSWDGLTDGVYAVRPDLKPANASEGNETCIGVGLVNAATGQKLMIEKYENANASYKKSFEDYSATSTSYYYFYWGYYGKTMNSLLGISDYPLYTKVSSSYSYGYVPDKNGNYYSSSYTQTLGLPSTWPTDATQYALADRAGKQHSEYLMQVTESDSYTSYPKMGQLLKTFLASSDALGYNDWYIPACGQLALFYIYKSDINAALTAIGGTTLDAYYYWSSSEVNPIFGWYVYLNNGRVDNDGLKNEGRQLRFVRNL